MLGELRALFSTAGEHETEEGELKRGYPRKTVPPNGTVFPVDTFGEVLIPNASQSGILREADTPLTPRQATHVSFDGHEFRLGVARWRRDRRFGFDFTGLSTLSERVVGVQHGSLEVRRPCAVRTELAKDGRLAVGTAPCPCTDRNVSRMGMPIEGIGSIFRGKAVLVQLGNRPMIRGSVQWTDAGKGVFKANAPLSRVKLVLSCD